MKIYTSIVSTIILAICGGVLLLIAILSGIISITSLIKRMEHGRGLLFADVEFFGFIAFICSLLGGLAIYGAKRLTKRKNTDVT